jgi:hypothetical protein
MTYEVFKIFNFNNFENKHTKVCDYAIKKLFGLHFQL